MVVFYCNTGIYVRYLIFRLELTYIAICTYLIVAYIKYEFKSNYSVYETMQISNIYAFDKTSIRDLFCEQRQLNRNIIEQLKLFEC